MATQTPNHKLIKPEMTDKADISMINPNWDTLDTALKAVEDRVENIDTSLSKVTSQAGIVRIETQSNTWAEVAITFRKAFASIPSVVVTHSGEILENLNIQTAGTSTTGITIRVKTTSAGSAYLHWIAVLRT